MPFDPCIAQQVGRRRVFWTTQPLACGEYFLCGSQCVIPGLEYIDVTVAATLPLQIVERAAAIDTVTASVSSGDMMITELAAADSMQDATLFVLSKTRILSASRAGLGSAAIDIGSDAIVSDIGVVN